MKRDTLRPYSPSSIHFIYLKQYKMYFLRISFFCTTCAYLNTVCNFHIMINMNKKGLILSKGNSSLIRNICKAMIFVHDDPTIIVLQSELLNIILHKHYA